MSEVNHHPPSGSPNVPQPPTPTGAPARQRNTVGIIALVTAVIGFIFACIPGALIVGWVLLPIAFVLSIVGLALTGKKKATAIAAIIISIVGFLVGVIVFFLVVGSAIDEAFGETGSEIIAPNDADSSEDGTAEDGNDNESGDDTGEVTSGDEGSRGNPVPLGSTIRSESWDITITDFDRDGTAEVLKANQFNEDPAEGNTYAIVEVKATYTGDDESGVPWVEIDVAYVTESGNTINTYDSEAVGPSPDFNDISDLYQGASDSGKIVLEIPEDDAGLLRVTPGLFSDDVFVTTK